MKLLTVEPSSVQGKRFVANFETSTGVLIHIHFGSVHCPDYTQTHDKAQRAAYIMRHAPPLRTPHPASPTSEATLTRWILYGSSTKISENVLTYKRIFNV